MLRVSLLILIFSLSSCKTIIPPKKIISRVDPVTQFFNNCISDLNSAAKVIVKKDMVKNLTHLQKMNSGGRHFYLLERESATNMINSAINQRYYDYIIINRHGNVIYTMYNNELFNENVKGKLKMTPYSNCYHNKDKAVNIIDIKPSQKGNFLYFSKKVNGGNSFPGIFILKIDIKHLKKYLKDTGRNIEIVGMDGLYRISKDDTQPLTLYNGKIKLSPKGLLKGTFQFKYDSINWYVLETP